jgi:pyrroline-5-carboxylate reductase
LKKYQNISKRTEMKLTIIGAGKMGEAIIAGLHKDYEITVFEKDEKRVYEIKNRYNVQAFVSKESIDIDDKNILLCIKPDTLKQLSKNLKGTAASLMSILAGTPLKELKENIKAKHFVRVMPNLGATFQKSMTTLTGDENFKDTALKICKGFGEVLWLESEKELDIATAVAGSGPAYLALVAEALSDGAVKEGLKREYAQKLTYGLFEGFAPLLKNKHPAIIKDEVMSPAGTTAQGYSALEEGGVRDSFIKAVERAYKRTLGI